MPVNESPPQVQDQTIRLVRLALGAGIGYLLFVTFLPFFSAFAWAAILSYALYPLYRRLVRATRERRTLSAALMSLVVTVGMIMPILYLSFLIGEELARTYRAVVLFVQKGDSLLQETWRAHPLVARVLAQVEEYQQHTGTDLRAVLVENLTSVGRALVEQLTQVATNALRGLVDLGLILLCSFFFFRDGEAAVAWIRDALPLSRDRQELVLRRFDEVVHGAIYGNFLVSLFEGIVGGLAFLMVGLPSPVMWGAVMGLLAYLPLAGAAVVWVPAALVLFVQGAYGKVTVLGLAGALIAVLDYFVRNKLVADRVQLHPLLVFFGVLGGIQVFGLLGIVAGPLLVAIGRTLVEAYWMERVALAIGDAKPGGPIVRAE